MPTFSTPPQPSTSTLLVPPAMFTRASPSNSAYEMRVRASPQSDSRAPSSWAPDMHAMQRAPSEMSHTSSGSFATANDDFDDEERGASSLGQPSISGLNMEPRSSVSVEDDRSTLRERRRQSAALSEYSATWEGATAM
jgi:hypothetical protein